MGKSKKKEAAARRRESSILNDDKRCLYLCSLECKKHKNAYVIRSIRLHDLLSDSKPQSDESGLREEAYTAGEDLCYEVGCGLFGSKILYAGGENFDRVMCGRRFFKPSNEIFAFDTKNNMEMEKFESFQAPKYNPLLVELQGKLYALTGKPNQFKINPAFEVFDPAVGKWATLPDPPFLFHSKAVDHDARYFSYAVSGNNILVSTPNRKMIFIYPVYDPPKKWATVGSFLFEGGPFPFRGKALVVSDVDQLQSNSRIMFAYTNDMKTTDNYRMFYQELAVYLVEPSSMQTIRTMGLPDGMPEEFLCRPHDYSFANLGGYNYQRKETKGTSTTWVFLPSLTATPPNLTLKMETSIHISYLAAFSCELRSKNITMLAQWSEEEVL